MQLQVSLPTNKQQTLLKVAEDYFRERVAPTAEKIDREPKALKEALKRMGDRCLLALRVPRKWGGAEFSELDYRRFQMSIARYSGALAFLQSQHQSAGWFIVNSDNKSLQQEYLSHMGKGEILVGIGFSQLRRHGEPMMKATPVTGGYLLEGEVPWIAGYGFFDDFIVGATLPDGQELYGIVPLHGSENKIHISRLMELAVIGSTNTVSAKFNSWFLGCDRVLSIKPPRSIDLYSQKNVLHHGFFALGCARAALDIIEDAYYKKELIFIKDSYNRLDRAAIECSQTMFDAICSQKYSFTEKLRLRVESISLAGRCSQAAIVASGGSAASIYHPAQRVYREALLYHVSAQTTAIMKQTLAALSF
ncbi:MAG: acyl-CoA dehydrogenase family protein [Prochloraceae cyanobacterium]|nr:acyl-CoA dehydrogenase family protein [Prochloraceae cyanobacterium]